MNLVQFEIDKVTHKKTFTQNPYPLLHFSILFFWLYIAKKVKLKK
jgi:hypothetical protein